MRQRPRPPRQHHPRVQLTLCPAIQNVDSPTLRAEILELNVLSYALIRVGEAAVAEGFNQWGSSRILKRICELQPSYSFGQHPRDAGARQPQFEGDLPTKFAGGTSRAWTSSRTVRLDFAVDASDGIGEREAPWSGFAPKACRLDRRTGTTLSFTLQQTDRRFSSHSGVARRRGPMGCSITCRTGSWPSGPR